MLVLVPPGAVSVQLLELFGCALLVVAAAGAGSSAPRMLSSHSAA